MRSPGPKSIPSQHGGETLGMNDRRAENYSRPSLLLLENLLYETSGFLISRGNDERC